MGVTRVKVRRNLLACASVLTLVGALVSCATGLTRQTVSSLPSLWPTDPEYRTISSGYGQRNGRPHRGVDIPAKKNERVRATASGRVVFAGRQSGFGRVVRIDHGDGYTTLYAHLAKRNTKVGRTVARGEVIGRVGRSGNATGHHLHYEVHSQGRAVNPRAFLP